MSRAIRTHFRPAGRGKTACGIAAKRSRTDTANLAKVTCRTCHRTAKAWQRWAKARGIAA